MKVPESVLNDAYQDIEKAVFGLADLNDAIKVNQKYALIDEFFRKVICEFNIEEVD